MTPTHFIIHTIDLKPGTLETVKAAFEEAVPKLASSFSAWCGARLTVCPETGKVVTIGAWADVDQMKAFLAQPEFNEAMAGFAEYFAAPPLTTVTGVLTEVGPS